MTIFVQYSLIANTFLGGSLQDCACEYMCGFVFFFKKSHFFCLANNPLLHLLLRELTNLI
jgi:hypothetical protein